MQCENGEGEGCNTGQGQAAAVEEGKELAVAGRVGEPTCAQEGGRGMGVTAVLMMLRPLVWSP